MHFYRTNLDGSGMKLPIPATPRMPWWRPIQQVFLHKGSRAEHSA